MYIYYSNPVLVDELQAIAAIVPDMQLVGELSANISDNIYLYYDDTGLNVYAEHFKPVNLTDFYRQFITKRRSSLKNENLLQAINLNKLKSLDNITALDLTGGLGRDSILMALAGINVTVVEENPYLVIILNYLKVTFTAELSDFNVIYGDSAKYLSTNQQEYHIIYYDPMFADNKQALSKKDMQLIDLFIEKHNSLNNDVVTDLIYNYVKPICHKLIVKRDNKQATFINQPKPTYQKLGKTIRFDVYQCDLKI